MKKRTSSKLFSYTLWKLLRNILNHHPAICTVSCLCSWRCWSIPWRNIKSKNSNVVVNLNSCLPLFWDGNLSANFSPLSTAGSKGVIHWRPYDLASQSMKFLHYPALPAELYWLALGRYVRLDGCTLANFLTHISLYLPYFSISLLEISRNGHSRHFFYEFWVKQSADVPLLLTSLLVSMLLLASLLVSMLLMTSLLVSMLLLTFLLVSMLLLTSLLVSMLLLTSLLVSMLFLTSLLVSILLLASLLVLVSLLFIASLLLLAFLHWLAFLLLLVCLLFTDPRFWDVPLYCCQCLCCCWRPCYCKHPFGCWRPYCCWHPYLLT